MGFFRDMLKPPPSGVRSFVVQVNTLGEVVIYRLDDKGDPSDFTVGGSVKESVQWMLDNINPRLKIETFGPSPNDMHYPFEYHLKGCRWREAVKILNGKGLSAGETRCQYRRYMDMGIDIPYIREKSWCKFEITQAGIDFDAARDAEREGDE